MPPTLRAGGLLQAGRSAVRMNDSRIWSALTAPASRHTVPAMFARASRDKVWSVSRSAFSIRCVTARASPARFD